MGQHARCPGDRVATVYLHAAWPGRAGYDADAVRPVEGGSTPCWRACPREAPRGLDTRGTSFGALTARDAVYSQGYDAFTLADFCDGHARQGL